VMVVTSRYDATWRKPFSVLSEPMCYRRLKTAVFGIVALGFVLGGAFAEVVIPAVAALDIVTGRFVCG